MPQKLTTQQVANLVGKERSTIAKMRTNGSLSGEKKGRKVLFDVSEILRVFPEVKGEDIDKILNVNRTKITNKEVGKNVNSQRNSQKIHSELHKKTKEDNDQITVDSIQNQIEIVKLNAQIEILQTKLDAETKRADDATQREEEGREANKKMLDMLQQKDLLLEDLRTKEEEPPKRKKFLGIF